MYRLVILQIAKNDIKDAAGWYEYRQRGLGRRFAAHVRKQLNTLKSNPERFINRYDETRTMVLDAFPFMAHYIIDEHQKLVVITAVLHTSRNPEIWKAERNDDDGIDPH